MILDNSPVLNFAKTKWTDSLFSTIGERLRNIIVKNCPSVFNPTLRECNTRTQTRNPGNLLKLYTNADVFVALEYYIQCARFNRHKCGCIIKSCIYAKMAAWAWCYPQFYSRRWRFRYTRIPFHVTSDFLWTHASYRIYQQTM